ncbi:MAG: InlB B-repeat-containing protein [Clostridia bacterium]|nr:InlB B-repeat-containing protein [Clostridia bacterium]
MTKKLISVLLALALVLTCGIVAFAEDTTSGTTGKIEVLFDANTGEGTMEAIEVVNGTVTVPECTMTKNLYVFTGWNTNADGSGTAYAAGDVLKTDESVTLFAQWIKEGVEVTELRITYNANGGEGVTEDTDTYLPGFEAMTQFCGFTREGYTFYQWNTKADNTGDVYGEFVPVMFGETDIVLYAIWYNNATGQLDVPGNTGNTNNTPVNPQPGENEDDDKTEDVIVDESVESDTEIPETGDASATAIALATGIVALGALVVLKKKQ